MKKNNKGFTLIELIIAITLMLSLTILVIVGYTKISDEKKNEADALTEKQIETAAEQYFSSNYFYVDYMKKDSNAKVFVNLAELVQEDYLNVTSKTSTEKKYDSCDIVYASYSGATGIKLNYIPYDDVFKEKSKAVFGYDSSSGLSYSAYLKTLGLDKTEKKCTADVFVASDVVINIEVDNEYYKKEKSKDLQSVYANSVNWYNDDIPLLITISNKNNDNNPKNVIKNVDIKINNNVITSTELSGSTHFKKMYRVIVNNNNANNIFVSASTEAGKEGNRNSTYYIDKEAPTMQMVAYKTNDTSIANRVPSFSTADNIASNTWINASSNKKNIYMYIKVNDDISGVGNSSLTCTRKSDDGADANKVIISTNGKQYNKLYFLKNDKVVTYECEGRDAVGNLSGKQTFTIKRDVTKPTISLAGYYSSDSNISKLTINNLDNSIKKYSAYSSNSWTNQSVVLKVTKGDNQSGVKTHSCTNPQDNSSFTNWSRVYGNTEGKYNYSCEIEDNAGNTASTSFIVKRDITKPTISLAGYYSSNSNIRGLTINNLDNSIKKYSAYSSNSWTNQAVVLKVIRTDSVSGIQTYSCTNQKNNSTFTHWSRVYDQAEGTYNYSCTIKDKAGNTGSTSFVVKRDITKPTCSVQTKGNVKTVTYSNYKYNVKASEKTNQTGWYSDKTINISFSSKSDSLSGINSYGLVNSSTKSYNSKTSVTHTTETSGTTWYGYVKDKAGNENKCSRSLKNDYTAPTITASNAGSVRCKDTTGKTRHSWGYSLKFKDNLSGSTVRISRYYSSASCNTYRWHNSSGTKTISGNTEGSFSSFARCDGNPNPRMKFVLRDGAGNVYNSGNEFQLSAKGKSNSNTGKCNGDLYYTFK